MAQSIREMKVEKTKELLRNTLVDLIKENLLSPSIKKGILS
jgi:hypothetical protein